MKKRLLIRINSLRAGGAERVLITFLNYFDYEKYQVTLLVNRKGYALDDEVPDEVDFRHLFKGSNLLSGSLKDSLYKLFREVLTSAINRFPQLMKFYLKKENPDVEIAFWEDIIPEVAGSFNEKSLKVAWIHSNLQLNQNLSSSKKRRICQSLLLFDKIIAVSNQASKSLIDYCGSQGINTELLAERITVIHNPIDSNRILNMAEQSGRSSKKSESFSFMAMGTLSSNKGFDRLIKAHKNVLDLGLEHNLWIAGTGQLEEELMALIRELNVEDSVELLGHLDNPYPRIKEADVFVLSSESEGFSLVLAEAMILSKPILSTNITGANELLQNGKFGKLVQSSVAGLSNGIQFFLENSSAVSEYAQKANIGSEQFSLEEKISQLEEVMDAKR